MDPGHWDTLKRNMLFYTEAWIWFYILEVKKQILSTVECKLNKQNQWSLGLIYFNNIVQLDSQAINHWQNIDSVFEEIFSQQLPLLVMRSLGWSQKAKKPQTVGTNTMS